MRFPRTSSIIASLTVVSAAALVGFPKVNDMATRTEMQSGQLSLLRGEVQRLNEQQLDLQSGMSNYRNEMEQQALRLEVEMHAVSVANLRPNTQRASLRRDVLRPVFQVSGEEAVGSAVLVYRGKDEKGSYYLALSCYHVLRDIIDFENAEEPHEVLFDNIFDQLGDDAVTISGRMIAENIPADLALLRIDSEHELGPVASIAPLVNEAMVDAFTPVYTVGCPLGTSAQATKGEVTRKDWVVDGQDYWMVSSPAYFGNSGGGVFLEENHQLVGIFSKIYTHGSYRPQVVTHMGLAVPLSTIHKWVESIGYQRILPQEKIVAPRIEEASSEPIAD